MPTSNESLIIGKDIPWKDIQEEDLRVKHFTPFAIIEGGKVKATSMLLPYASLIVESPKLPEETYLPVTHKIDFRNLWEVFKERGVKDNEEVLVFYVPSSGIFSAVKPKLHIFIYPKGHQEEIYNPNFTPDNSEMWFKPIAEWQPE